MGGTSPVSIFTELWTFTVWCRFVLCYWWSGGKDRERFLVWRPLGTRICKTGFRLFLHRCTGLLEEWYFPLAKVGVRHLRFDRNLVCVRIVRFIVKEFILHFTHTLLSTNLVLLTPRRKVGRWGSVVPSLSRPVTSDSRGSRDSKTPAHQRLRDGRGTVLCVLKEQEIRRKTW